MTIEEAIAHAREVAENKRETVKIADETYPNTDLSENETYNRCKKCAEEHEQLAERLEELKKLREHNEKYKWHDLRKDPDDLPDSDRKVECRTITKSGVVNPVFGYYADRWCCGMNSNVIKWREIELFEEG